MAAQGLKTSRGDHIIETGTLAFIDSDSNLMISLENLLLEDSKINKSFYGVRIDTERLNFIFQPLLPSGFDFSKSTPPHLFLDVAMKCQIARIKEQSKADICLLPKIKNLGRLWYRELIQELERQPQITTTLIRIYPSGFLHRLEVVDVSGDEGSGGLAFFGNFTIDKATRTVVLHFRFSPQKIKCMSLNWQDFQKLSAHGILFFSLSPSENTLFPNLDTMLKDLRETDINKTVTEDRDHNNEHEETPEHIFYPSKRIPHGSQHTNHFKDQGKVLQTSCQFCDIIIDEGNAVTKVYHSPWDKEVLVLQPIDSAAEGHIIAIPREHLLSASSEKKFRDLCEWASEIQQALYPGMHVIFQVNQG